MFYSLAALYHESIFNPLHEYIALSRETDYHIGRLIGKITPLAKSTTAFVYHWGLEDPAITFRNVKKECPGFGLLINVADAARHAEINKYDPLITKATSIEEVLNVVQFRDFEGGYQHAQPTVNINLDNGEKEDLLRLIVEANNFFSIRLMEKGVLKMDTRVAYGGKFRFVYRHQVPGSTFWGQEGFDQKFQIVVWDYDPMKRDFIERKTGKITTEGNKLLLHRKVEKEDESHAG